MNTEYDNLTALQEKIHYHFHNPELLLEALTHSSYANERIVNKMKDYERLEFLGDSILELVSSEFIFHKHPDMPEGKMSKLRASLVCEQALAYSARDLSLGTFLRLGKGEDKTGGRERASIIADVMEAITGAIFLDSGLPEAKQFILKFILEDVENKNIFSDSKTVLQEYIQQREDYNISYQVTGEEGPEHAKVFTVDVLIDGKVMGTGQGRSKKIAEQNAAYEAIRKMKKS